MSPIYLDYNATTPIDPEVAAAMRPFLDMIFGNPSSSHLYGTKARQAVEEARRNVSALINCNPDEIIFTSGGSESNNLAIKGMAYALQHKGNHIITSAIEHPAVTEVCAFLQTRGFTITTLPVDEYGRVHVEDVEKAITKSTILITIMHANNEVGTIQPVAAIGKLAHTHGIIFHCDAAQSVGKIPVDVKSMHVDMLSIAGHKLYAPKGIGALYIRQGLKPEKLIHGADHEFNMRAGTENVLEIAGFGKACETALRDLDDNAKRYMMLRDKLYTSIIADMPDVRLNGHPEERLPNTLSLSFYGIEANTLLSELSGVAASAGAACHAGDVKVSRVLEAMNVPVDWAMGTIRFSTGKFLSEGDVEQAGRQVVEAVRKLDVQGMAETIANDEEVKLTRFTHGLGCACKLRPQVLEAVLKKIPRMHVPAVLVGNETSDDAAVYRLNDDTAIVETLDFFTPVVDNPYDFGSIAAANALSDIYAMGAKPIFALNIAAFPSQRLPVKVLEDILLGASDKAAEAGIPIIGGHTVDDTEPKFGLAVTGLVHPGRILLNSGAKPGDVLILTKPLGTGIIATAAKQGLATEAQIKSATAHMSMLNKTAAEVAEKFNIHACTDITGFGLLGHLKEMAEGSDCGIEIETKHVPLMNGVYELALAGAIPGGTINNLDFVKEMVLFDDAVTHLMQFILADAQTSGGLVFSLPQGQSVEMLTALKNKGINHATVIGRIVASEKALIWVK